MPREFLLELGFGIHRRRRTLPAQATADVVLDQQLELINGYGVDFDYHQNLSQSFTVGAAGLISKLGVQLYRLDDGLDTSNDVFISIGSQWLPVTHYAVRPCAC